MNLVNSALSAVLPLFPRFIIKPFAKPYVAGETIDNALQHIKVLIEKGFAATVDILGEHVENEDEAHHITQSYIELLNAIHQEGLNCNLSIKPTHIGLDTGYNTARDNLFTLLNKANEYDNFVRLDMENSPYTDATIKMYLEAKLDFQNVGPVIQAYLHRSKEDINRLKEKNLNVRICKGIYRESEHIAFQNNLDINAQFVDLVKMVIESGGYAAIATHDISLIDELEEWIIVENISNDRFEFQVLFGVPMSGRLEKLKDKGYVVRVYVPFGESWHDYSIRRLKENPRIISYVMKNIFKKH